MSRIRWEIHYEWPFIRRHVPVGVKRDPSLFDYEWVRLPDGRSGIIHHDKPNGLLGVRPLKDDSFEFYPNPSTHWSDEDRLRIPEEVAIHRKDVVFINPPK